VSVTKWLALLAILAPASLGAADGLPSPPAEALPPVASVQPERDGAMPPSDLLAIARRAVDCAQQDGRLPADDRLVLIDFSRASTEKRMWVLQGDEVLFHERVAHGQKTGDDRATVFSDTPGSHQSSLGLFVTAETYSGKHGYSLRLDGLEPGWNGRARERAIVVHGADYATDAFVQAHGRLGRSWGCPAVDPAVARPLIDAIAEGTPLFAWHDASAWLGDSDLNCSSY
jgi:hypothetical protein